MLLNLSKWVYFRYKPMMTLWEQRTMKAVLNYLKRLLLTHSASTLRGNPKRWYILTHATTVLGTVCFSALEKQGNGSGISQSCEVLFHRKYIGDCLKAQKKENVLQLHQLRTYPLHPTLSIAHPLNLGSIGSKSCSQGSRAISEVIKPANVLPQYCSETKFT